MMKRQHGAGLIPSHPIMWCSPCFCAVCVCILHVCVFLCMTTLCNTGAPTVSDANTIDFIVSRWQRQIIHWRWALLNLCFHPHTHQSTSWTQCLWYHHLMSDKNKKNKKIKGRWLTATIFEQCVFCQQSLLVDITAPFFGSLLIHNSVNKREICNILYIYIAHRIKPLQVVCISPNEGYC